MANLRKLATWAQLRRALGLPVDGWGLEAGLSGHGPEPDERFNRPGGGVGSQNIPISCRVALGDYRWATRFAHRILSEGWREDWSEVYLPDVLADLVVALKLAREAGDGPRAEILRLCLRSFWTGLALAAWPTSPRRVIARLGPGWRGPGSPAGEFGVDPGDFYQGPCLALAGERAHVWPLGQSVLAPMLAFALDWPGRGYRRFKRPASVVSDTPRDDAPPYDLALTTMAAACGGRDATYDHHVRPEPFGLTTDERLTLRWVVAGTSRGGAGWLHPAWGTTYTWIRTPRAVATVQGNGVNGNKPPWLAAVATAAERIVLAPSPFRKVGAIGGVAGWRLPDELWANSAGVNLEAAVPGDSPFFVMAPSSTPPWLPPLPEGDGPVDPPPPPPPPPPPDHGNDSAALRAAIESLEQAAALQLRAVESTRAAVARLQAVVERS